MNTLRADQADCSVTDSAAAVRAGVPVKTIREWAAHGLLDFSRPVGSKSIHVGESSLEAVLAIMVPRDRPAKPPGSVRDFLTECTSTVQTERTRFADIYAAYMGWAADRPCEILGTKTFGRMLGSLGFHTYKAGGVVYKLNIRLKPPADPTPATPAAPDTP